jgi:hypothetical protein
VTIALPFRRTYLHQGFENKEKELCPTIAAVPYRSPNFQLIADAEKCMTPLTTVTQEETKAQLVKTRLV